MLDRIRHLEIVRQVATKHEDGHEERGVEREDEALEGELLLEPACGIGAVPHLLHVARLTNLGIQVIVLSGPLRIHRGRVHRRNHRLQDQFLHFIHPISHDDPTR